MGIPLQQPCAGCGRVGSSAEGGVVFTAAECFTKPLNDAPQVAAAAAGCPCTAARRSSPPLLHGSRRQPAPTPAPARPSRLQLWACSVQCKREALYAVLRDLPYRTSKREQQMALALQMARERSEQAAHRGSA